MPVRKLCKYAKLPATQINTCLEIRSDVHNAEHTLQAEVLTKPDRMAQQQIRVDMINAKHT